MDLQVPPPSGTGLLPARLIGELARHVGEPTTARIGADLLGGADPRSYPNAFRYFADRATDRFLAGTWGPAYWSRVWGARSLLYVWSEDAAPAVLDGLSDDAWRVAEMCLKVSARREVAAAGDPAVPLAAHDLSRVRGAAMRLFGKVGDTEHIEVVRAHLEDTDEEVRGHADRALRSMVERLDL